MSVFTCESSHRHGFQTAVNNGFNIPSPSVRNFLGITCHVPGSVSGSGPVPLNKTNKVPAHLELW